MANYEDTLLAAASQTMRDNRGVGTPGPPSSGITPPGSPQGDYAAGTVPSANKLISPELQSIIDKVTGGGASMAPNYRRDLVNIAGTIGGLQQNRQTEAGQMTRLGVTGARELEKTNITQTGETARQNIATIPGLMRETRAGMEVPGSGSSILQAGGVGEPAPSILDDWKHPAWNIGEATKRRIVY